MIEMTFLFDYHPFLQNKPASGGMVHHLTAITGRDVRRCAGIAIEFRPV